MQFLRSLAARRLRELNPCHMPAGTSAGGQFAPKDGDTCAGPAHGPLKGEWTKAGRTLKSRRATTGPMRPATKAERRRYKVPPSYTDAMAATSPRAEVRATAVSPVTGKTHAYYSASYSDHQALAKWSRIAGIHRQMPSIIKKVDKDSTKATSPDQQPAIALRLILQTGMRNGADNEHDTYGATSLQLRHVTVKGATVTIDFPGKKGVDQHYEVTDPVLAKYVKARERADDPDGKGPLFDHSEQETLDYMKKVAGPQYKVHDVRTWFGTVYADQLTTKLISEGLKPTTKKERIAFQRQVGKKVGQALGNTASSALTYYVHPWVFKAIE